MPSATQDQPQRASEIGAAFDAVIVGAGFAGMYMLHRLRELGFTARVYEAGGGVGGTWYWNRYPGARCDVESMQYSFSFSEGLDQQWDWSEQYAPHPELLSYANHVPLRGREDFQGPIYRSGEWPHEGVDFTGLRVGVIGTGSSAIQSIPIIAQQASALTVFQRTATYSVPAWNTKLTPEYRNAIKADYPAPRAKARARPTGFYFTFNIRHELEAPPSGSTPL